MAFKRIALTLIAAAMLPLTVSCSSDDSSPTSVSPGSDNPQRSTQAYLCEGQYRGVPARIEGERWTLTNPVTGELARQEFDGTITRGNSTIRISHNQIDGDPVSLLFLNTGVLEIWERRGSELSAPFRIGTLFCR